jgi:hypothetical protein
LPGPDEINYFGYTDPGTGDLIIKMVLHSGASLVLSCPDNDEGRADMLRLVGNFHAYMNDMSEQFSGWQERWFNTKFEEIAINEDFEIED